MLKIHARIDGRDVIKGFDRMATQAAKTRSFYTAMKRPVKQDIKSHTDGGPAGPWAPRSKEYMRRVRKPPMGPHRRKFNKPRKKPPRKVLGKLTRSIRQRVTRGGLFIMSPIEWAGIHQEGGRAGRGAMIPARPFLWLSGVTLKFASAQYAQYVLQAWPSGTKLKTRKKA